MKKDNVFSIVAMGCGLLIILSVFLPYVSYFGASISLWKAENPARVLYILLGLLVIGVYLINKKTELSYLSVGFCLFTAISDIISMEGFDGLSVAFYLILLSSLTIGVLTFLYEEKNAVALINLSLKINKPIINNQTDSNLQITNHQSLTNEQSTMQNKPVITGYDPMTGSPIYSDKNNN